jgi:hypothetical protein
VLKGEKRRAMEHPVAADTDVNPACEILTDCIGFTLTSGSCGRSADDYERQGRDQMARRYLGERGGWPLARLALDRGPALPVMGLPQSSSALTPSRSCSGPIPRL